MLAIFAIRGGLDMHELQRRAPRRGKRLNGGSAAPWSCTRSTQKQKLPLPPDGVSARCDPDPAIFGFKASSLREPIQVQLLSKILPSAIRSLFLAMAKAPPSTTSGGAAQHRQSRS